MQHRRETDGSRLLPALVASAGIGLASVPARALEIARLSPQGEVGQVLNVVVQFKDAARSLGDLRGPAPVRIECASGIEVQGSGRWTSEREWVFDFRQALPAGARCKVVARDDFRPSAPGAAAQWTGRREFAFQIAAPKVEQIRPWAGSRIAEDQRFLLRLSGAAKADTIAPQMWCESKALGERLPAQLFAAAERDALMKALRIEAGRQPWVLAGCARPLPPGAEAALVWGPGIAAAADPAVRTRGEQRFRFEVRAPLKAEFACERERAQSPCLPIRPLSLTFSEPIPRSQALAIRLRGPGGQLVAPVTPKSDTDAEEGGLRAVVFPTPLPEQQSFQLELPPDVHDLEGRPLANARSFPLTVRTGAAPPLAKFAASPFGIVEWEREGPSLVPLSVRHVQPELQPQGAGTLVVKRVADDLDVLRWYARLQKASQHEWTARAAALLQGEPGLQRLTVPRTAANDAGLEVVGVPLSQPGYHVLEFESPRLGQSLLEPPRPMFVRTGVLVTNLGLHFKRGNDNSLAWVTRLDSGRPVADAQVAVYDCSGQPLWSGRTDQAGLARIDRPQLGQQARGDRCLADDGLYVTARAQQPGRDADFAFLFSSWDRGIEPWRFNLPVAQGGSESTLRAHTVTDRPLLRTGETLSMKHFVRVETMQGLADVAPDRLPDRLRIVFDGTGEDVTTVPLQWQGSRHAVSTWKVPAGAKLGRYRLLLDRGGGDDHGGRSWDSGSVRVEAFRVPLVDARLLPPKSPPAGAREFAWGAQLNYLAGGPMARAPVEINAVVRPRWLSFPGREDFAFEPPAERGDRGAAAAGADAGGDEDTAREAAESRDRQLVLDKLAVTTDAQGAAQFKVPLRAPPTRATELRVEMNYRDPDGQTHTRAASQTLWPADVQVGLRAAGWAAHGQVLAVQAIALDAGGKPVAGRPVAIAARQLQTLSTRKRLVGGFYAYEHRRSVKDLGELCSGTTDAQGLFVCDAKLVQSGQIELVATAHDAAGRASRAARQLWVTRAGELWFEQDNDDRIDVIPERRRFEPGETARFQVRMPYRDATALVTVEREGVIHSEVRRLSGRDPWLELKVQLDWTPNAYVGVMVLRGRLREVPWYSFFTWGWKEPLDWWRERQSAGNYKPPTAMVDLAKPSYKLGVAAIEIGRAKHALEVEVVPQQTQYGVRQTAQVKLRVTQGGRPVADALVAFAAVDEGLLALAPNPSWKLLDGLFAKRGWGVGTSTAHGEIVGRRHYGRKAVAAGGGGGFATRELFDTLLTWQPAVAVNAQGEAVVSVPINDSLTRFRLVAVADAPGQRFGTGENTINVSQDLQLLSGLPPLVREGDRLQAMLTVRNATARAMNLRVTLQGQAATDGGARPVAAEPKAVSLAAGGAQELAWDVVVPEGASRIDWTAQAAEQGGGNARDAMKTVQRVEPAVPLRVLQATLRQLDGPLALPAAAPADALTAQGVKRGGLQIGLQPRLSGALPGIRRYFEAYEYICLEQLSSKAIALHDDAGWQALTAALSTYQDGDGLLAYFPLSDRLTQGSDVLTAYLLSAAHEAGRALPQPQLDKALAGLAAFVEGRIARRFWSPRADDEPRRLAALAALARHGRASPRMLGTVDARRLPHWPTGAVIDWLVVHQRLAQAPQREAQIAAAHEQLRSRLSYAGTTLRFVDEAGDAWWWLMHSVDGNAARAILALADDPGWRDELPRMVSGTLARQQRGAWFGTTANLWGVLALERFSARFESQAVKGRTEVQLADARAAHDWSARPDGGSLALPWPAGTGTLSLLQAGEGRPWATVQALAAVPLNAPLAAGYRVERTLAGVAQKAAPAWSRGDVMRVRLEVDAAADMSWVVLSDPLPAGATVLQGTIEAGGERAEGRAQPVFVERGFSAWRAYFEYLPRGRHVVEYTVRLNNAGRFQLPTTRAEAMYAPDRFGERPNATLDVRP